MKTSKVNIVLIVSFLFVFLLSACGGGQAVEQPVDEPAAEPEIEPEIVDLGNGVQLLLRGLPEDIIMDANLDPNFKDNLPPSKNFDYVHTDTVVITFMQGGEYVTLEKGVAELCFTTTEPNTDLGEPKPYYWDTTKSPLVDGRGLRISEKQEEPEYMICTMVQNSGAFAIVAW